MLIIDAADMLTLLTPHLHTPSLMMIFFAGCHLFRHDADTPYYYAFRRCRLRLLFSVSPPMPLPVRYFAFDADATPPPLLPP